MITNQYLVEEHENRNVVRISTHLLKECCIKVVETGHELGQIILAIFVCFYIHTVDSQLTVLCGIRLWTPL